MLLGSVSKAEIGVLNPERKCDFKGKKREDGDNRTHHFNTLSSSRQVPIHAVLISNRCLSTQDVGPGFVGQPDAESQHRTLPGAAVVVEFFTPAVGVAKAQVELAVHPHG